jgi:hypothetical protein
MTDANAIAAQLRGKAKPTGRKAEGPTPRNLDVMAYLHHFFEQNDQLPPVATVCEHFGWKSLQAGQDHVDALLRHGLIERNAVGKLRFARGAR